MSKRPPLKTGYEVETKKSKQGDYASEKDVLLEKFKALLNVLTSNDLYADFTSEGIITLSEFHELSSHTNPKHKAELFLEKISLPVDVGLNTTFYVMLNVIRNNGNNAARELSNEIIRSLSPNALITDSSVETEEGCFTLPDEASKEFGTVLADVAEELSKYSEQNLEKVKNICYSFTNGDNTSLISQEDKDRIRSCDNILEVFLIMQLYWNWCSHYLLMKIIQRFRSPRAKKILEKFEKKINYSMKLKVIYEKNKESELQIPQGHCKMIAIINKNHPEITLKEWLEIELIVFKCLDVPQPPSEINISQCIETVWYISTAAVDSLRSKGEQHKELLNEKSFKFLQVGDTVVFDTSSPYQEISDSDDDYEDAVVMTNPDEVDVAKLDYNDLIWWLSEQKIALNKIQEPFKEHKISGEMFLDFTKKEMQRVVTDEETVLKLQELQMKVVNQKDALKVLLQHYNLLPTKWLPHFENNNIHQPEDLSNRTEDSFATFKAMLSYASTEEEQGSLKILLGITNFEYKKQLFIECLNMLGLIDKFPELIKMKDARMIHQELLGNIKYTEQIKMLPYLILQKIFMFDCRSRGILFKGKHNHTSVLLAGIEKIHPLDSILLLLHCCDNFLRQEIFSKLATCQIAIPILLPNPYNDSIIFPLWAMRSIIKSWKSHAHSNATITHHITDYPAPVISFLKIGNFKYSKSKLINEVISDCKHNYFFTWHCEGGSSKRLFIDGLGEICCYLPSEKSDDLYQDMLIFLNLRGSALNHKKQVNFIKEISYIIFLLLDENKIEEKTIQFLGELSKTPTEIILLFPKLASNEQFSNKEIEESLNGMQVIKMADKNDYDIRSEIWKELLSRLQSSRITQCRKIINFVSIACKMQIKVDEDNESCIKGKSLAEQVIKSIRSVPPTKAKSELLPIQGPDLWQKWATLNKESYRTVNTVERVKFEIRHKQNVSSQNLTPVMNIFLHHLLEQNGTDRLYYLQWLKMFLDDYSRETLPQLEDEFQEILSKLNKAVKASENHPTKSNCEAVRKLRKRLKQCNEDLVRASFGLEHLFREVGQIYEARMENPRNVPKKLEDEVADYPQLIAELMQEGFPIELIDGDASHVPVTWVLAVINKMKNLYAKGNPSKIFVISVLGMQNTGKSTLLNTMFGLHFSVSARRCTRGAYFQLLPLSDKLIEQTNCHYIMVVDTEGLGAPELYFKESFARIHDNELATFVIGVADITVVNIYGANPGDLKDVLETAVLAFMRMKEVEMNASCHFAHQNMPVLTAAKDGKYARQQVLKKLDDMTKEAAKTYYLEGKYSLFRHVIHFDNETDFTFFPGLLQGDPPTMAPINTGYSDSACSLKKKLFTSLQERQSGYCTFTGFQQRVRKLWEAVLREKYVFNFKNMLTVMAYSELDKYLCDWSWILKRKMLELQAENAKEICNCEILQVNMAMQNCLTKSNEALKSTYDKLLEELKNFFDNSDKADILHQWKKQTEIRLKNILTELKDAAKHHCEVSKVNRERHVQLGKIERDLRQQLYNSVVRLTKENQNVGKSDAQRLEFFDKQWKQWFEELSKFPKPEIYASNETIDNTICEILAGIFEDNPCLVFQLHQMPLADRHSALTLEINHKEHLISSTSIIKGFLRTGQLNDKDILEANRITQIFLNKTDEMLKEAINTLQDYDESIVFGILKELRTSIEEHDKASKRYKFAPKYIADISIVVASYASGKLKAMVSNLKAQNDPMKSLTKLKPILFRNFNSHFTDASKDQTAADNLSALLAPSIRKALVELLRIEIVDDIRHGPQFKGKKYFIAQVLQDLANKHNFDLFKAYLCDPASSFKYWAKVYIEQHCQAECNGETKIIALAKVHLHAIIKEVIEATNVLKRQYAVTDDDNNIERYSEDSMDCSTNLDKYINMDLWLESFFKILDRVLSIDSQEVQQMIGKSKLSDLSLFTELFIKNLNKEKDTILQDFTDQSHGIAKITEWPNSPHFILYNTLIGCTEQCPFCKEQCEYTDPNHLKLGKAHFAEIHRPQCLGRYIWLADEKLVMEICTELVESEAQFRKPDTDPEEFVPYKDYDTVYEHWLISNENPRCGPIYWQWFCAEFNDELVDWVGSSITTVPSSWKQLTKDDAINSLCEIYRLNLNI